MASNEFEPPPIPEDLLPTEEWYEPFIRYGLYFGAAFQLICILAVLVLPPGGKKSDNLDDDDFWGEVKTHDAIIVYGHLTSMIFAG